jgi:CHAT domain-containing protein/Tfp pilus assembly protein PilF
MMTPFPFHDCFPRSTLPLLLFAALLGGLTPGCRPAPKSDLQPGKAVVREIGGTEAHTYRLPLEKGTYLRMRIDQPGIDVTAKLVGPGGQEVGFFEEPQRWEEPDRLAWIAKSGGEYRLAVRLTNPKAARGKYRLTLQELSGAKRRDSDRLSAERDYEEARRLLATGAKEAKKQSLDLFRRSLRIWEDAGDRIGQVDALIQIAQVDNDLSQSTAAIPDAQRALQISQGLPYPEGVARALLTLGDTYYRSGNYRIAFESSSRSLPLFKELQDTNGQGAALFSMGQARNSESAPEEAARYYESARPLLSAAGNRRIEAYTRIGEGWIQTDQGRYGDALENAQVALNLGELTKDESVIATTLLLLGNVHKQRGELAEALAKFNRTLSIYLALGDRDLESYTRQGLGSLYFNLGEPEQAITQYTQAFNIISDPARKARLLVNTGYVYQQGKHDPRTALNYYNKALTLLDERSKKDLSTRALTLNNIGTAEVLLGNPKNGLDLLLQALKLREQAKELSRQANTLLEIGTAYNVLGDPRRAADSYRQALRSATELGNTDLQSECFYRWALLDRGQGDLPAALQHIRDSVKIVESVRGQVVSGDLRTSFFATKRDYYELLVSLLAQLEMEHPGKYRAEALEASERARARSLRDLLAEGSVQEGIPQELQRKEVDLRSRLSWLQSQLGKRPTPVLEAEIERVQGQMVQLQIEIQKSYEHYANLRYPTPLRSSQIQDLVDDKSILLHYFVGEEASFLFAVTRKSVEIYSLPGSARLAEQVTQLRRSIEGRGPRYLRAYQQTAAELYSVLLAPAATALRGKSRLLIAPDGPLYLLPFEALLSGSQGGSYPELPYLLRLFAISYVPSASVLADLRQNRLAVRPSKQFLAFADPDYGTTAVAPARGPAGANGRGLAQLPASGLEVSRIASLYPAGESALYLGAQATKKNLRQNPYLATTPRVHFALHGIVDAAHPELSGLELSDGRLQMFEIFNLKMNADLLTLSGCETALGQEVRGEGMIGLTRAFLYAGARSLVVSLWPVTDRSTSDFMFDMYHNLGAGKVEALRQAKLAMISSKEHAEPYYWAPFILSGDPR